MKETITVERLFMLISNYSELQIKAIYKDEETEKCRKVFMRGIIDKAIKINDKETIALLYKNYDINKILSYDISEVSSASMNETDQIFSDISKFVKEVDPNYEYKVIKQRKEERKKQNRDRRYGGKSFRTCFNEKDNGEVEFSIRKYLYKTTATNVRYIAEKLDCPKEMFNECFVELIPWILIQPRCKDVIINFLKTHPDDSLSIPYEDIVDLENGNISII